METRHILQSGISVPYVGYRDESRYFHLSSPSWCRSKNYSNNISFTRFKYCWEISIILDHVGGIVMMLVPLFKILIRCFIAGSEGEIIRYTKIWALDVIFDIVHHHLFALRPLLKHDNCSTYYQWIDCLDVQNITCGHVPPVHLTLVPHCDMSFYCSR